MRSERCAQEARHLLRFRHSAVRFGLALTDIPLDNDVADRPRHELSASEGRLPERYVVLSVCNPNFLGSVEAVHDLI